MREDVRLRDYLYEKQHPWRVPLIGLFLSRTLCLFGHQVVVMDLDTWDEPWLACKVCGGRFLPARVLEGGEVE